MSKYCMYLVAALVVLGLMGPAMAADPGMGNVLFEYWYGFGGVNVSDLTGNADYPDNPSSSEWRTNFLSPVDWRDNYGTRARAYVYPPQTGDYTFWVAGDDQCHLFLSTDEDPANATLIAEVPAWTPAQDWNNTGGGSGGPEQKSDPVRLEAGKRYYIEALQKDEGGGDSVGVAWGGPGIGAGPVLLDGKYCAAFLRDPEPMFMARNPTPTDGEIGVMAPLLTWDTGATVTWHNLYFGTDPNPPFLVQQMWAMYYHVPGLEPGAIYYWKVDEVEDDGVTIYEGDVWSFVAQSLTAYYPGPADAAPSVSPTTVLTWQAGKGGVTHHLYLSTDPDAVSQRTAAADKGVLEDTTFDPEGLAGGVTYYWAVDEIAADASIQVGDVWSFTTFILVDDFESYVDEVEGRIFQSWIDGWGYTEPPPGDPGNGTSATVGYLDPPFAETTVVHTGTQSMPLDYNNIIPPYYSETERTFAQPMDWTVGGATDLSLWVRGYPAGVTMNQTAPDAFSVTGEGVDIWDASDQFTYVFKTLNGDGSLVARVVDVGTGSNNWAKGGVMIRDTLAAGSTHAMQVITASEGNGASFQWRPVADDVSSNSDALDAIAPPYWVKIERLGNSLSGYLSPNGTTWTRQGTSQVIFMTQPLYIGLCVTSHTAGENRTFEFDNVTATGSVGGQWQFTEIGLTRNDAATLYVGIRDSTGRVAVVPNPDPGAVNVTDWTEWPIPLSEFTGVSLNRIAKMFIGVGDRDNPTPDGHGMLFIDDIRVVVSPPPEPAE